MGFQITLLLATFFYVDYFQANMPTFSGWFLYHVIMHSTKKIGYFVDKLVVKSRKTTKSIWRVAFDLELLRGIYVYPTCHCHRNRNIKCSIQRLSDLVIQGFNYKNVPGWTCFTMTSSFIYRMTLTFILEVKDLQSGELKLTGCIHDICHWPWQKTSNIWYF